MPNAINVHSVHLWHLCPQQGETEVLHYDLRGAQKGIWLWNFWGVIVGHETDENHCSKELNLVRKKTNRETVIEGNVL